MESQRLKPSVFGTTLEPQQAFTLPIGGTPVTFPPGTPLVLNYRTAGLREAVWDAPRDFKPYERAAQLWGAKSTFWYCHTHTHTHTERGLRSTLECCVMLRTGWCRTTS